MQLTRNISLWLLLPACFCLGVPAAPASARADEQASKETDAATAPTAAETTVEPPSRQNNFNGHNCIECHRQETGKLADIVEKEWMHSTHYDHDVTCEQCHGGDPTLRPEDFKTRDEFKIAAHASFSPEYLLVKSQRRGGLPGRAEATVSSGCIACHDRPMEASTLDPEHPDATQCPFERHGSAPLSRERAISYMCASCHPASTEKYLNSPHGIRGAPSCLFCHGTGTHDIKDASPAIVDPRPSSEHGKCSICHAPDIMTGVAHVHEVLVEARVRIRETTDLFDELEGHGYQNLALTRTFLSMDKELAHLRQVQHGCNLQDINDIAKSIETVQKRVAYDHELVLGLDQARHDQTWVAFVVVGLLLALALSLRLYRHLVGSATWWDQTLRDPVRRQLTSPCVNSCPAGNNIQGFVQATANKNFDEALEILMETTPFPGVCGRVCPAPCMTACNRCNYDGGVNIRELERFVAEHGQAEIKRDPSREERVAVIGGGPAGLSATYQLARLGYHVTIFEREADLGGVLQHSIPAYRLPRDVVQREIDRILQYPVTVKTGQIIDRDALQTIARKFDGVIVATGLQDLRAIELGEAPPAAVQQGIRFLEQARTRGVDIAGMRVVVIGGGNVAMDVARTARRFQPAGIDVYCLESREEMPALPEEITEALEEDIRIHNRWGPVSIESAGGRVSGIVVQRCTRVFDADGRFAPQFDQHERTTATADVIILSLGQAADVSLFPDGEQVSEVTPMAGFGDALVLAAGDVSTSRGTVAGAIGGGRRAALMLHEKFSGEDLMPCPAPVATVQDVKMHAFARTPRAEGTVAPAGTRREDFREVALGLPDDPAHHTVLDEASRCFSCGVCNQCDRCTVYCPEGIILRDGKDFYIDSEHCRGCGRCATECPRGVLVMREQQIEWDYE